MPELEEELDPEKSRKEYSERKKKKSMTSSLLILGGLMQVLCGIVLPVSNSFSTSDERNHMNYSEAFFLVQYIVSVFCICYLIILVHNDLKIIRKKMKNENKNNDTQPINEENSTLKTKDDEDNTKTACPSDDKNKTLKSRAKVNQISGNINKMAKGVRKAFNRKKENIFSYEDCGESSECNIALDKHGVSIYLRLGAVIFGFGVMMHSGFKVSDQLMSPSYCRSIFWIPANLIHFVFVFIQTYFVFKYHRVIFNTRKSLIKILLVQLVVTNVCQWFKIVIFEINEELSEEAEKESLLAERGNETVTPTITAHQVATTSNIYSAACHGLQLSQRTAPFLFPCAVEYSLIACSTFYKILQKVGNLSKRRTCVEESGTTEQKKRPVYSSCHKSNKGLFLGLVVFMVTVVSITLFMFIEEHNTGDKFFFPLLIYQSSEISLHIVSLITCIMAFMKMNILEYHSNSSEGKLDDNLLLIGASGIVSYDIFIFLPAIEVAIVGHGRFKGIAIMFVLKSSLEIIQTCLQSLFIMEISKRRAHDDAMIRQKPGRSMVIFLFIINLGMWLVNIFEVKRAENNPIHTQHYQKLTWNIVTHLLLPLIIFYRFHSTVCLSEIWSHAYR